MEITATYSTKPINISYVSKIQSYIAFQRFWLLNYVNLNLGASHQKFAGTAIIGVSSLLHVRASGTYIGGRSRGFNKAPGENTGMAPRNKPGPRLSKSIPTHRSQEPLLSTSYRGFT